MKMCQEVSQRIREPIQFQPFSPLSGLNQIKNYVPNSNTNSFFTRSTKLLSIYQEDTCILSHI